MARAPWPPATGGPLPPGTLPLRVEDPTRVGDYQVIARFAAAEPGSGYLARDRDGTKVVVKIACPRPAGGNRLRRNFADAAAARLPHRYTARIIGKGLVDGTAYLVREYVDGLTLSELVAEDGRLDHVTLNAIGVATAAAITAVHDAGDAHGNLKPSNIMITLAGVRLLDHCLGRQSGQPRPGPSCDVLGWGRAMTFAGTGGRVSLAPSSPRSPDELAEDALDSALLDTPIGPLVHRALDHQAERRPRARELLLGLVCPSSGDAGSGQWRLRKGAARPPRR